MPFYKFTGPDGGVYQFTAPDEDAANEAYESEILGNQTSQQSATPPPSYGDIASDVGKSIGTGLVRGAVGAATFPRTLQDFVHWGTPKIMDPVYKWATGNEPPPEQPLQHPIMPSYQDMMDKLEGVAGPLHEPTTAPGRVAETVSEFVPSAAMGPGGMARRFIQGALVPGVASQAAGELTAGQPIEPYARAAAGFAAGAAFPHVATPIPMNPNIAPAMSVLEREGIADALTAGQRTGSKNLQRVESVTADVPFSFTSTAGINERGAEAFTRRALNRVNIDAPRTITPDNTNLVDQALTNNSNEFNRLTAANEMKSDPQLWQEVVGANNNYERLVPEAQRSGAPAAWLQDLQDTLVKQNGRLTGEQYQSFRSQLAADARASNDSRLSHTLSDMTEAMDDAMERSANPSDVGAFRDARRIYRNLLVIEKASTGAGQATAQGLITPPQLTIANRDVLGRRAQARSQGEFSDLARAGVAAMTPLPDSGTASRAAVLGETVPLTGILSGAEGWTLGGAAKGLALAIGGPAAASWAVNNPITQRYLRNQAVPRLPGQWRASPLSQLYSLALMGREPSQPTGDAAAFANRLRPRITVTPNQ
jgi:hypothetical protein